ncbi:MAG: peptidylprolyl isomerase [Acidobacteria bacterium]|nr:peptidylprolyl isomerase [Acidobacteriota bacterium]
MRLCAAFLIAAVALAAQTAAKRGPAAPAANKLLTPAALNEKAPEQYRARFTTTKGQFVIRVVRNYAPLAADRFYNLVKNGFYDGTAFHRVHPGFVAQFGLHPNPAIQARWEKAKLKDEKVVKSNLFGWVAFAADGADGRNTQIYVSLKDNKSLDGQGFPPFGDIEKGIGVFATIYGGYGDKPNQQTIVRQGAAYLKRSFPQTDYVTKAVIE